MKLVKLRLILKTFMRMEI